MPKNKKVAMKDISERLGISRATISYVINNTPGQTISQKVREEVLKTAYEMGYESNAIAKSLRGGKTNLIGFLTDNISNTPFIVDIIRGAQDAALEKNKTILMMDAKDHTLRKQLFSWMGQWQVEGIIFAESDLRETDITQKMASSPLVLVGCFNDQSFLPSVLINEKQGGYAATKFALQKGHKRVGFINGPECLLSSIERGKGYREALSEFGIEVDPSLIRTGDYWQESGYNATIELLSIEARPTAIFCANDYMALGAYDAVKNLGLRIPEDIAIIGFDNREIIAAHMRPALTTVALPYYEMGRKAFEILQGDKPEQNNRIYIDCPLIVRGSV